MFIIPFLREIRVLVGFMLLVYLFFFRGLYVFEDQMGLGFQLFDKMRFFWILVLFALVLALWIERGTDKW